MNRFWKINQIKAWNIFCCFLSYFTELCFLFYICNVCCPKHAHTLTDIASCLVKSHERVISPKHTNKHKICRIKGYSRKATYIFFLSKLIEESNVWGLYKIEFADRFHAKIFRAPGRWPYANLNPIGKQDR